MIKIKNYFNFIKQHPFVLIVGTIVNIFCLISDNYNKVFDNNIFNFLFCEYLILMAYLFIHLANIIQKK